MKIALTVNKEDVLQIPNEYYNECTIILNEKSDEYLLSQLPYLEDLDFELKPRFDVGGCEEDLTRLQPLPYITVYDKTNKKFFTYLRGKGGDEGRLHDMLSMGLGGHIEEEVEKGRSFSLVVHNNILAELKEEANIILNTEEFTELYKTIQNKDYKLIYSTFDKVAQVHLCMWFCIELEEDRLTQFEEDNILEHRWFTFDEFEKMIQETGTELEYWSQITYQMLKEKYNK